MQPVLLVTGGLFCLSVVAGAPSSIEVTATCSAVQPLLAERCTSCHKPGEIGSMPLTSYAEVRPWAKAIKEAVLTRTMPPWFADPKASEMFRNDRSLSADEIQKIVSWVDAGAPAGEPADVAAQQSDDAILITENPSRKPGVVIKVPAMQSPHRAPSNTLSW